MADTNTELMAEALYQAAKMIGEGLSELADAIRAHSDMLDPHLREIAMSHHEMKDEVAGLSWALSGIKDVMGDD